jgi:hypothetical protein
MGTTSIQLTFDVIKHMTNTYTELMSMAGTPLYYLFLNYCAATCYGHNVWQLVNKLHIPLQFVHYSALHAKKN